MDMLFLELILWGGLLFLFWALKDGLGQIETEIEQTTSINKTLIHHAHPGARIIRPESVSERIGSYKDVPIYHYAVFNGVRYEFERACPDKRNMTLRDDERYLEPGLIYIRTPDSGNVAKASNH